MKLREVRDLIVKAFVEGDARTAKPWLDNAMETGRHAHGYGHLVLLELLEGRAISKGDIEAALASVRKKEDERYAAEEAKAGEEP